MRFSELQALVYALGLLDEIEECLESQKCDVRELVRSIRDGITSRLAEAGREAVERVMG